MGSNSGSRTRKILIVPILLVLLLAAGLRFYRIDAQSFWNDEGNSVRLAERSLALIVEGSAGDIHPPLYYMILKGWRTILGTSEFAARSLSAVLGVALVLVIFLLGRKLINSVTGLIAALLAAVNPLQVYYSQEARSYILVSLLGAIAVYAAHAIYGKWNESAESQKPKDDIVLWMLVYIVATTAGLYTHYLFPLIILAVNLIVLLSLLGRRLVREAMILVFLNAIALILYIPWISIAFRQLTTWPSSGEMQSVGSALVTVFRTLSLGITVVPQATRIALLGFGFLLALGLMPRKNIRNPQLILLALWLLLPIAIILMLDMLKPAFLKFLLVISPPFCILVARGIGFTLRSGANVRRALLLPTALSLGMMISYNVDALHNLYHDPAYARTDYRGMAQTIQETFRDTDAIILNAPNQWEAFTYYYHDVDRVYPLPLERPAQKESLYSALENIKDKHDRVYCLFWAEQESDPDRLVEHWLDDHGYKARDEWWGDVRFVVYALAEGPAAEPDFEVDVLFGEHIRLEGYSLVSDRLMPDDVIQLTLFWQATETIEERYKVFLHLLSPEGQPISQRDSEPGGGLSLTSTWEPGTTVKDNHGVLVPHDVEPGTYQLVLGLYPLHDPNARLPVVRDGMPVGDTLPISHIVVTSNP
ncbi:MAG: glycosyltransferase family 39 protein [Chloroflexota bacterium]